MSELQVAGRDTCIIFLTAAEIFPGVVSPSGSNAREPPRRRRRLDLTVRALMKIQLRNEVVLTMKNVDSQIPPFRAVCTIPDFKVRRTLLGLMWCDIKALTQLTQHNMFFLVYAPWCSSTCHSGWFVHIFKTGCFHSCLSSVGQIFHMMIYDPQHACRAAGGVN